MGTAMGHHTEKHKMITGQLYRSGDDLLREERRQQKSC